MFLGNFDVANSVANSNIPIKTLTATNRKIVNNTTANVLELREAGIYNVDGWVTASGPAGTVDINIIADGVLRDTIVGTISADNDFITLPIVDAVRAVIDRYPQVADISLQVGTSGLTLSGLIRVEYLQ